MLLLEEVQMKKSVVDNTAGQYYFRYTLLNNIDKQLNIIQNN